MLVHRRLHSGADPWVVVPQRTAPTPNGSRCTHCRRRPRSASSGPVMRRANRGSRCVPAWTPPPALRRRPREELFGLGGRDGPAHASQRPLLVGFGSRSSTRISHLACQSPAGSTTAVRLPRSAAHTTHRDPPSANAIREMAEPGRPPRSPSRTRPTSRIPGRGQPIDGRPFAA